MCKIKSERNALKNTFLSLFGFIRSPNAKEKEENKKTALDIRFVQPHSLSLVCMRKSCSVRIFFHFSFCCVCIFAIPSSTKLDRKKKKEKYRKQSGRFNIGW